MAVLVFGKTSTVYHYPAGEGQPEDELTRCGITGKRRPLRAVSGDVPTNWEPCDRCSEIDDRDQRFVGTF